MKYNFDEIVDRSGSNCLKWDLAEEGVLPLWVADMDFKAAPCILSSLQKRLDHGIFGYTIPPQRYFDAVINWFGRRHGLEVRKEWMLQTPGVLPGVSASIKAVSNPGDKVLILPPVYNHFYCSIRHCNCVACESNLIWDGHSFTVDWEDFEAKAADPAVKAYILCNPHNPAGRVWTKEELLKMGEICLKHNVFVISDEIHCEIVSPGFKYIPFASLSEDFRMHSSTCCSPTKGFNIAGIHASNVFVANPAIREKVAEAIENSEANGLSAFAVEALIAAYEEGEEWLTEMNSYVYDNYLYLKQTLAAECPAIKVAELEGTYLAWLDCSAVTSDADVLSKTMRDEGKVWFCEGSIYGEAGRCFLRVNLATPRAILEEGLKRAIPYLR